MLGAGVAGDGVCGAGDEVDGAGPAQDGLWAEQVEQGHARAEQHGDRERGPGSFSEVVMSPRSHRGEGRSEWRGSQRAPGSRHGLTARWGMVERAGMFEYSPAWPHGVLQPAFSGVHVVIGTNRTHHAGVDLQTSRTMVVICDEGELTIVNSVRLDEAGLRELDALGRVRHVVRLGAFHGRDDPFYCDRYGATLWALPGVEHADGRATDRSLTEGGPFPVVGGEVVVFASARFPEAAVLLARDGGVLITCDAIQNWTSVDGFFSRATGEMFAAQGLIGEANIPATWLHACAPEAADYRRLSALPFRHLITGHGEPLRDVAHARVAARVAAVFPG